MFGGNETTTQNTLDGTFKITVNEGRVRNEIAFNNGFGRGRTEVSVVPNAPRDATFLGTFSGQGVIMNEQQRPAIRLNGRYAIYTEFKNKKMGSNFITRI